jgi:hypothetical protein
VRLGSQLASSEAATDQETHGMTVDTQDAIRFRTPFDELRTASLAELDALVARLLVTEAPDRVEEAFARRIGMASLDDFNALREIWRRHF